MAVTIIDYTGDGTTNQYAITFSYLSEDDVVVTVNEVAAPFTFVNSSTVQLSTTPASGDRIVIKRNTAVAALVDFTDGSTLYETDLDLATEQARLLGEEARDRAENALSTVNANLANILRVQAIEDDVTDVATNIADINTAAANISDIQNAAGNAATATTKANEADTSATAAAASETAAATSETNAATSETNAASSASAASTSASAAQTAQTAAETAETNAETAETNAATSATNAATSETNAASSAANAATSETNAATSETNAATSATNAATSATAAAASQTAAAASAASAASAYDTFDDRYLGSKSANPTVDNDGNALVQGSLFFNSTANEMRVYDGGSWIAASSAGGASMLEYLYIATAGQTAFNGSDENSNTLSYTATNLIVIVNGVVLEPSVDYTATDGLTVTLTDAAALNDEVHIIAFKSFTTADMVSATNGGTFGNNITVNGNITVVAQ